jgi:penicillin-binding protein 1C
MRPRLAASLALLGSLMTADLAAPPPIAQARQVSSVVVDRNGDWLRAFTTPSGRWRLAADLDRTDPRLVEALVALEDERFFLHPGVDPAAVVRAIAGRAAGTSQSGASTLTMQVARLMEPRPRTYGSKFIEMARALQLERRLAKREILETWLTLAPYGGNLEGVRAASRAWWGREPTDLTWGQIALLIALPQSPEARRPDRRPQAARVARDAVLDRLVAAGVIDRSAAVEAKAEPIPTRTPFPRLADHAALRVKGEGGDVTTTLDASMQRMLEARLAALDLGSGTAAAMIVETRTRAVRALVGSSNRSAPGGEMDMTRAYRSPGSTLKPFVFALAFEDGVAAPASLVEDLPTRFGSYMPENFDRAFHGDVRVAEALQHSLNVPAVAALDRIGAQRFRSALQTAGLRVVISDPSAAPGLALALGGAGVRMDDLAMLYAGLADGGAMRPLAWTPGDIGVGRSVQFCAPEAAGEIAGVLRAAPALAGRLPADLSRGAPVVAAKTGTSYGFRDAWAVGFSGDHTIAVWIGRPDGAPRPGQMGRSTALPVLYDLFDAVGGDRSAGLEAIEAAVPEGLSRMQTREGDAPVLVFPPDDAEIVLVGARGLERGVALSARGGAEGAAALRWFVDGAPLDREPGSGRVIWRPSAAGFYTVRVVDRSGSAAEAQVRVRLE